MVSYSYPATPQQHSKDVVYGSGSAAEPKSSDYTLSGRSPSLDHTTAAEYETSDHIPPSQVSTITPLYTTFESSKLSYQTPSPSYDPYSSLSFEPSSFSSAPSSFIPSSYSPSPYHSSSTPPSRSFPSAIPVGQSEATYTVHQAPPATVLSGDPSQFAIKDSTFQVSESEFFCIL